MKCIRPSPPLCRSENTARLAPNTGRSDRSAASAKAAGVAGGDRSGASAAGSGIGIRGSLLVGRSVPRGDGTPFRDAAIKPSCGELRKTAAGDRPPRSGPARAIRMVGEPTAEARTSRRCPDRRPKNLAANLWHRIATAESVAAKRCPSPHSGSAVLPPIRHRSADLPPHSAPAGGTASATRSHAPRTDDRRRSISLQRARACHAHPR